MACHDATPEPGERRRPLGAGGSRQGFAVLALVALVASVAVAETTRSESFDDVEPGALPAGFEVATGQWAVTAIEGDQERGRALAQTHVGQNPEFNVVLVTDVSAVDLELEVDLRARRGKLDQGGGLVWRARDAQNYYVARYNPLEDNFRAYKVVDGVRRQIASARVEVDHGAWHRMRVTMTGDRIEGFLDGKRHLAVRDKTFRQAGQVGLWTKADAHTEFDNLQLGDLKTDQ